VTRPQDRRPRFREIADDLRARILDGTLGVGSALRAEDDLAADYGASTLTIRRALDVLQAEALIVRRAGHRTRIADRAERSTVRVPRGSTMTGRRGTAEECTQLGVPEGSLVMVVQLGDREPVLYAVELTVFSVR
jgi:GntR family transcriptional regulator